MTEADKVSELHQEVKNSLLNEDLEKVKNWQKDAYHKQIMGGFKETKEAEDGFRKAQKPWAKKMKEVPRLGGGSMVRAAGHREGVCAGGRQCMPSGTTRRAAAPISGKNRWVDSAPWVERPMDRETLSPGRGRKVHGPLDPQVGRALHPVRRVPAGTYRS